MGVGMMLCCDVGKKEQFRLDFMPSSFDIFAGLSGCFCFVSIC
jgi:hypothetical protein